MGCPTARRGGGVSAPTRKRPRSSAAPWWARLPTWRVTIAAHEVPPRWSIPATVCEVGASTAEIACGVCLRFAHSDAGVPPLRSLLAVSRAHVHAERVREVTG